MGIKKKLGLGVASAALGISLVGGGTWAAFNDIEVMNNKMTAGILDLTIDQPVTGAITVSKLVPGDTMERSFKIQNNGNVDIDKVFLDVTSSGWSPVQHHGDGEGTNTKEDFLSQFQVELLTSDGTNLLAGKTGTGSYYNGTSTVNFFSLKDLEALADGTFDISHYGTDASYGLPNIEGDQNNRDSDEIKVKVKFVNDLTDTDTDGEYDQNKYQGETVDIEFKFEATQVAGTSRNND